MNVLGEFPILPHWLFCEEPLPEKDGVRITAYGPGGQTASATHENPKAALAGCVRLVLESAGEGGAAH